MNLRGIIIMLICLIGFGGFWYIHDHKGGAERAKVQAAEERLFPNVAAVNVSELTWTGGQADPSAKRVFKKVGDEWLIEMTGNLKIRASSDEIGSLLDQVATLSRTSVVMEKAGPGALAQYGLDKPAYVLTLTALPSKDGEKPEAGAKPVSYTLRIGGHTPDESAFYMQVGSGSVLEVAAPFTTTFNKPLDELREKALLVVNPARITGIKMEPGTGNRGVARPQIVLARQAGSSEAAADASDASVDGSDASGDAESDPAAVELWDMQKPLEVPADAVKVKDFLWAMRSLDVQSFLHPDDTSFGAVQARLELSQSKGRPAVVLEVGQNVPGKSDEYYVRRLDPMEVCVVKIPAGQEPFWTRGVADFEDRHLGRVDVEKVMRVALETTDKSGRVVAIEGNRIRDGWEVVKPSLVVKDESTRDRVMNELVYALADLEWSSKATGTQAAKPVQRAKATLYGDKGDVLLSFLVGQANADGTAPVWLEGSQEVMVLAKDPCTSWAESYASLDGQKPAVATQTPVAGKAQPAPVNAPAPVNGQAPAPAPASESAPAPAAK